MQFIIRDGLIHGIAIRLGLHKADGPAKFSIQAVEPIEIHRRTGSWVVVGNEFCGVRAFVAWVAANRTTTVAAEVDAARQLALSCPTTGPVFVANTRPILKAQVVRTLRSFCAGEVAGEVHGHSIRIASVMCLDRAGVAFEVIRRFGRWKSASACEVYLRGVREGLPPLELGGRSLDLNRPVWVLASALRLNME